MRCPTKTGRSSDLALEYLSSRLEPETAQELERHCAECPACREYFAAQRAVWQILDEWEAPPTSPGFDRELQRRIAAEKARGKWWRTLWAPFTPRMLKPAAAFAGLAVIVAAAVLLRTPAPVSREAAQRGSEAVDVEQIEQVVEDLDMLYLLDPVVLDETVKPAGAAEPDKVGSLTNVRRRGKCA